MYIHMYSMMIVQPQERDYCEVVLYIRTYVYDIDLGQKWRLFGKRFQAQDVSAAHSPYYVVHKIYSIVCT